MLPRTVADPKKGLAQILNRIRIYQAWAQKDGTGLAAGRWGDGTTDAGAGGGASRPNGRRGQGPVAAGYLARGRKGRKRGRSGESRWKTGMRDCLGGSRVC